MSDEEEAAEDAGFGRSRDSESSCCDGKDQRRAMERSRQASTSNLQNETENTNEVSVVRFRQ